MSDEEQQDTLAVTNGEFKRYDQQAQLGGHRKAMERSLSDTDVYLFIIQLLPRRYISVLI